MKSNSEMQSYQERVHRIGKSPRYRSSFSERDRWMIDGVTLKELKQLKEQCRRSEMFTAIIDENLYVADVNMISVWQDDENGNLEFIKTIAWERLNEHSYGLNCHFKFVLCPLMPPSRTVELFHDKISILTALSDVVSRLSSTAGYYSDEPEPEPCRLDISDFEALASAITRDAVRILQTETSGYNKSRQYLIYKENVMLPLTLLDEQNSTATNNVRSFDFIDIDSIE